MKKALRKEMLKTMHNTMMHMNHEDAYMHWITLGVPDCPDESDFDDIASSQADFDEICEFFCKLYNHYKKYGFAY